jgi:hypothetical protein
VTEGVELQPDDLEVLQAERTDEPAVAVVLKGSLSPIRTQELPHKAGATFNRQGVGTTPIRVLTASDRRAVARVVSVGQAMYFALNGAAASDTSRMALWPANTVLTLTADTELWVASQTSTTTISVMTEFWATGE